MFSAISPILWTAFIAFVLLALAVDLGVFHRQARRISLRRESIGMLVTNLHLSELIPTEMLHSIMVLSETLNRAVHGEKMTTEEAQRSLETGKVVLKKLEP